jgi:hypothetical protein
VRREQPAKEQITRRLQDAIENLQREAMKVELWAAALSGFARPIPDYEPTNDNLMPRGDGERDRARMPGGHSSWPGHRSMTQGRR